MLSLEYLHHFCLRKHCPLITTKKPPSSLFLWHSAYIMPCHNLCPSFSFVSPTVKVSWGQNLWVLCIPSVLHYCRTWCSLVHSHCPEQKKRHNSQVCLHRTCLSQRSAPAHRILLECPVGQIAHLPHSKGSCNIVQRNRRITAPKVAWLIQRWAQGWDPGVVRFFPLFWIPFPLLAGTQPSIWLF